MEKELTAIQKIRLLYTEPIWRAIVEQYLEHGLKKSVEQAENKHPYIQELILKSMEQVIARYISEKVFIK